MRTPRDSRSLAGTRALGVAAGWTRVVRILLVTALVGSAACAGYAGYRAYHRGPAEPRRMVVRVEARGLGADEAERDVTLPMERAVAGVPGIAAVESVSERGLARLRITFDERTTLAEGRAAVAERLAGNRDLFAGATVELAPSGAPGDAGLHYTVESAIEHQGRLRSIHDSVVASALRQIPGVAAVLTCGGAVERIEVNLNPARMGALGVSLDDVIRALPVPRVTGGLRGARLAGLEDVSRLVLDVRNDAPVLVRDVASTAIRHVPHNCVASRDGENPVVEGVVVLQPGHDVADVTARIAVRVGELAASALPPSVHIRPLDFPASPADAARSRASSLRIRLAVPPEVRLAAIAQIARRPAEVRDLLIRRGRIEDEEDLVLAGEIELVVVLDPQCRRSIGAVAADLAASLDGLPGVRYDFSSTSGVLPRSLHASTVRLFGPDLAVLRAAASDVTRLLQTIAGIDGAGIVDATEEPAITVVPDSKQLAANGLRPDAVAAAAEAARGGIAVGPFLLGEKHLDLVVRVSPSGAGELEDLRRMSIHGPKGGLVPLGNVAQFRLDSAPVVVLRENGTRFLDVRFNARGRGADDVLAEVRRRLAGDLRLPANVRLTFKLA